MSKKKLLEFGLKEADAFQKNFKIIFDRLVRGYKSIMGREPEGLDLLKVKMEAREKALNTTKVVNQKGLTLDPDKPITGGTQEGIPTIKTKFDEELDEFNLSKDDPMGDLEKIVKGEGDTGLPKKIMTTRGLGDLFPRQIKKSVEKAKKAKDEFNLSKDDPMGDLEKIVKGEGETGLPKKEIPRDVKETFEEELGVKLYGDETFDELMIIKNTGKHPRDKADGGRIGLSIGGPINIIGADLSQPGIGLLGGMEVEEDEFADIEGQTAGLGVASFLTKTFGPKLGSFIFQRGKAKALKEVQDKISEDIQRRKKIKEAEAATRRAETRAIQSRIDRDPRGYDGSRGLSASPYGGGGGGLHSDYADGGLATMFVEKR